MAPEAAVEERKLDDDDSEEQVVVNPWEVVVEDGQKIDYGKIVQKFGCKRIDKALIDRIERLTGRPTHRFLRRGIFFAHRDLDLILDDYEKGKMFYLYTGRGPSSESLHLGHLVQFMSARYFQVEFGVPLVIQLTDDEKFIWKNQSLSESKRLARENAKDIIACGFDLGNTFIFCNSDYVQGHFREVVYKIAKHVNFKKIAAIFGFKPDDCIGKYMFPPNQAAPAFAGAFPHLFSAMNIRCLIPCAIDQDPYFRMARDVAPNVEYHKPGLIESIFFPPLHGGSGKMSASDARSAIYLTDSLEEIAEKVNRCDLPAGTLEDNILFEYLSFFLDDDKELEHIKQGIKTGMPLDLLKQRLVEVLFKIVQNHQEVRKMVTDEMVDAFMAARPLPHMFKRKSLGYSEEKKGDTEQAVNPRQVSVKDSNKGGVRSVMLKLGCQQIDNCLIDKIQHLTHHTPHYAMRRGLFFAYRNLPPLLEAYGKGEKFYIYTWITPSAQSLHLGQIFNLMFTKYLQDAFKVPVVIQLRDACLHMSTDLPLKECIKLALDMVKDILACGLDITRTYIFSNHKSFDADFNANMISLSKCISYKKLATAIDLEADHSKALSFLNKGAPSFSSTFPKLFPDRENLRCLIPCGIDQDGCFELIQDASVDLGYHSPALIQSMVLPSLCGLSGKMSGCDPCSAVYIRDSKGQIKNKVHKHAFSGGQDSVENQKKYGANLEVDVPCDLLNFFLEDDDELVNIKQRYEAGDEKIMTGYVKNRVVEVLDQLIQRIQKASAEVTQKMVDEVMSVRSLFPEKM